MNQLPKGFTLAEAVTLPNNFVTVFHSLTVDLALETPWPKSEDYVPQNADKPILIWGGSSSVGQFAIQILHYYGYTHILVTASRKHHEKLLSIGAKQVFDYNDADVVAQIAEAGGDNGIPLFLDCIGSKRGSITPISHIAKAGAKVAILLPVIVRDSTETEDPEYEMDVRAAAEWRKGVDARGVRTHFYLDVSIPQSGLRNNETKTPQNGFFKYNLQSVIMPAMLEKGIVAPQKQKIVEGATMLERAQKAMDTLRRKEASMERLVWRVSDEV
jgi:threonine dehydrogenase-like Zn-dependent dehydrogenase